MIRRLAELSGIAGLAGLAWIAAGAGCSRERPRLSEPGAPDGAPQQTGYVPKAEYCVGSASPGSPLCPIIPANIGPDPMLDQTVAYNGIAPHPTSPATDVQTPFDNLSWQTFVALNWTAGKENQSAQQGLQGTGRRVWENWPRVSELFGNAPVRAQCAVPPGLAVFQIGSNGEGQPVGQNEEYIQAATGAPLIDVSGNWTIYERRVNSVEVAYLKAPQGKTSWNLTTSAGQQQLVKDHGTVSFPSFGLPGPPTGAIEIKAAWRVLDPAQRAHNQQSYYVVPAMLTVAPDLVSQAPGAPAAPICTQVDLGLVAMHIIQKNPTTDNALKPEWFWSTFEHVDNAPLATDACDPTQPSQCKSLGQLSCPVAPNVGAYSYFNPACPDCATNQPPQASQSGAAFAWSPTQPFASGYLTSAQHDGTTITGLGTQVSRCWQIYTLTDQLNRQWRDQLRQIGSVFQNYMLIGTQWGASITNTPDPQLPPNGVPTFLSNTLVETYLQTEPSGSCVACHRGATLPVDDKTSSNLSFLPRLVTPGLVRRPPVRGHAH